MEVTDLLQDISEKMQLIAQHIQHQLQSVQAHKITRESLGTVKVNAYDTLTPLSQLARINVVDTQTLSVEPYEKTLTAAVEHAIRQHKKDHFVRQNKTGAIFVTLPTLTEERRKKLVKEIQQHTEQAKVQIRQKRTDAKKDLKILQKEGLSEDEVKATETALQRVTDEYIATIDDLYAQKAKSLMQI